MFSANAKSDVNPEGTTLTVGTWSPLGLVASSVGSNWHNSKDLPTTGVAILDQSTSESFGNL